MKKWFCTFKYISDRNHMQFCGHLAWVYYSANESSSKMIWPSVALQVESYPFQVVDMWHNKIITGLHTPCDMDPTHTLHERRPVIIAKVTFIYSAGQGWCSLDNEFVHALEHTAVKLQRTSNVTVMKVTDTAGTLLKYQQTEIATTQDEVVGWLLQSNILLHQHIEIPFSFGAAILWSASIKCSQ